MYGPWGLVRIEYSWVGRRRELRSLWTGLLERNSGGRALFDFKNCDGIHRATAELIILLILIC